MKYLAVPVANDYKRDCRTSNRPLQVRMCNDSLAVQCRSQYIPLVDCCQQLYCLQCVTNKIWYKLYKRFPKLLLYDKVCPNVRDVDSISNIHFILSIKFKLILTWMPNLNNFIQFKWVSPPVRLLCDTVFFMTFLQLNNDFPRSHVYVDALMGENF